MPKYLNTKPGSLESAVLEAVSPTQQAAIAIAKKEKGEKPKTAEELTAKQKKLDVDKDGDIGADDLAALRKKAKKEEVKEELSLAERAANHITNMWKEAAKVSTKKEEEEPKVDGKTMTGKPMSKVKIAAADSDKED